MSESQEWFGGIEAFGEKTNRGVQNPTSGLLNKRAPKQNFILVTPQTFEFDAKAE